MKRIKGIIQTTTSPDNNSLWLDANGKLKYLGPNGWTAITSDITSATATKLGGVKQGSAITDLTTGADAATILTKVNALLASLRAAGIIAN